MPRSTLSYATVTAILLLPAVARASQPAAPPPTAAPPPAVAPVAPAPAPAAPVAAPAAAPAPATPAPTAIAPAPAAAPPATNSAASPTAVPTATAGSATAAPATAAPATAGLTLPDGSPAPTGTTATTTVVTTTTTTTSTPAPAKAPAYRDVPFNLGIFPPLSINGSHGSSTKIRNNLSVAAGWSRVAKLDGIALAFGATVVTEDANGISSAFGANITRGIHTGIQAAHGYNHAGRLEGIQLAMVNHANEARGIQAGLLNISRGRVKGVQFGLINYAEQADASFALIPITKEGGVRPEVWTSDTAALNVGIRLPAKYTYAFFAGGIHPLARKSPPIVAQDARPGSTQPGMSLLAGMGYGGHLPVAKTVGIDADASGWIATAGLRTDKGAAVIGKVRAMVSWQLRPRIAIWGGPTLNVMVSDPELSVPRPGYGWVAQSELVDGVRVRWWPGFAAGLRF